MELSQSSPFRGAVKEKPYLTLRILQVPLDVTLDTLDTDLKSITVTDTDLHEAVNTLSHLTLVQMNKNSACATATFQTSLPKDEFVQRLQAAIQKDYQFDCNFYDITPLYDHQTDANTDLVAVSGLGGHGFGSWKDPTSDMMWLRDNLPKDIPHQRVIIYGHDTHLQGSDSKQSIEELGVGLMESITRYRNDTETSQRPIIFIGHSLGGLIIKEALLFSRNSRIGTSNIHKACHGMLFFGVPNHGLRYDQLSTIVQGQPNKALVESLLVDSDSEPSDYLKRISNQFSTDFEGKYSIISFYERKHTPTVEVQDGTLRKTGKPSLLVTKESATKIGVVPAGREDNIPFNTDHSGLVKYRKGNSRDYDTVRSRLERVIDDATTKISRQSTSLV
ncbi:hypothetical protein F5Y10DRAFT_150672 [Nemania abortiva]|nr:hypothetical protein F5Y10DRAFT_150672 [Nemania abortiva]